MTEIGPFNPPVERMLSRRKLLKVAGVAATTLAFSACVPTPPKEVPKQPVNPATSTPEARQTPTALSKIESKAPEIVIFDQTVKELTPPERAMFQMGIKAVQDKYGLNGSSGLLVRAPNGSELSFFDKPGVNMVAFANGLGGREIVVSISSLRRVIQERTPALSQEELIVQWMAHESIHATASRLPSPLKEPFTEKTSQLHAIQSHGFSLLFSEKNKDGSQTALRFLDEYMTELMALYATTLGTSSDQVARTLANLRSIYGTGALAAHKLLTKAGVTPEQISVMHRSNNLNGLLSTLVGKPIPKEFVVPVFEIFYEVQEETDKLAGKFMSQPGQLQGLLTTQSDRLVTRLKALADKMP
ncbi:MAG: twin-arginine translocation signal domain-containing protein [bacterium]